MKLAMNGISKTYKKGKRPALSTLNTVLGPGVYGILGPNGAGKSTLMNILTDNLKPDGGEVTYNDRSIGSLGASYRDVLGYVPQQQGLYEDFTGLRFLWYVAALKGLSDRQAELKIRELLEVVNLTKDAGKKIGSYSGGMKQRILIAQALLNDPAVLIMDEPTAGLDPKERIRIRNYISTISRNKIVIIATHVVSDIEYIAKQIILMKEGQLIQQDEPAVILKGMQGKVVERYMTEEELAAAQQQYKVSNVSNDSDGLRVRMVGDSWPEHWREHMARPNLEDVYLYLFDD